MIAAAGSGTRMGGVSKPLMKISGREALLYSLDLSSQHEKKILKLSKIS